MKTSTGLDDSDLAAVVERIVAEAQPYRIILFGSRASGSAEPDSDIDLLVVMPEGTNRRAAMEWIGSRLPRPGVGIDLIVATPSTLAKHRDNPGLIYKHILRTGRELYVAPGYDERDGE